jgi:hypothetical protein
VLRGWQLDWHAIGSFVSAIPARWIANDKFGNIAPGAYAHWIEIHNDEPVALWLAGERLAW